MEIKAELVKINNRNGEVQLQFLQCDTSDISDIFATCVSGFVGYILSYSSIFALIPGRCCRLTQCR